MTARELFLRLFYRERVGRLAQALRTNETLSTAMRGMHKRAIAATLEEIVIRAEDDCKCNDICKSMYFCDREKGHKGLHRENKLTWR